MDAIILAGGLGTRLQSIVSDVPKPMAAVGGRPFLDYILRWLEQGGVVSRVVLSIGHKGDLIRGRYKKNFGALNVSYCVEDEPLGTGGAIKKALRQCFDENVFVINGDTFFDADPALLRERHNENHAAVTIAVKEMFDFDRYGTVLVDADSGAVISFNEKKRTARGYINGGVYVINANIFDGLDLPDKFSFENDVLHKMILNARAVPFGGNFIDIGIPEDYALAQELVPRWVAL